MLIFICKIVIQCLLKGIQTFLLTSNLLFLTSTIFNQREGCVSPVMEVILQLLKLLPTHTLLEYKYELEASVQWSLYKQTLYIDVNVDVVMNSLLYNTCSCIEKGIEMYLSFHQQEFF